MGRVFPSSLTGLVLVIARKPTHISLVVSSPVKTARGGWLGLLGLPAVLS